MRAAIAACALALFTFSGAALAQELPTEAPRVEPPPEPRQPSADTSGEAAAGQTSAQAEARRAERAERRRARAEAQAEAPEPASEPTPPERPAPSEPAAPIDAPADGGLPLDGGVPALDASIADGGVAFPEARLPDGGALEAGVAESDAGVSAEATDAGAAPVDAGAVPVDAGAPIVPPTPEPSPKAERDFLSAFSDWMWERAERERETIRHPPVGPKTRDQIDVIVTESVREWLGFGLPHRRVSSIGLVLLLAFAFIGLWLVDRGRQGLPERGVVPRFLRAAHLVLRLSIVLLVLMLVSRLLPSWLRPALVLTIAAVAVALGFGAVWLLLPDVVAAVVLLTEGRLKRGRWVVGDGFAGTVEQLGPRVTVLQAPDGSLISVPNRRIIKSPVRASDRPWHEIEVTLRAPAGVGAPRLRDAIREAVLCSPHVPPDPGLILARDPIEPDRWRLKVRLIDVRFTEAFEGQLLERVEESLAHDGGGAPL